METKVKYFRWVVASDSVTVEYCPHGVTELRDSESIKISYNDIPAELHMSAIMAGFADRLRSVTSADSAKRWHLIQQEVRRLFESKEWEPVKAPTVKSTEQDKLLAAYGVWREITMDEAYSRVVRVAQHHKTTVLMVLQNLLLQNHEYRKVVARHQAGPELSLHDL